jgi:hypothetical protein
MIEEPRKFAMRGNMVEMAVGIATGAAFGKTVTSFVNGALMPPAGRLAGGVDLSNLFINPGAGSCRSLAASQFAGAATRNYAVNHPHGAGLSRHGVSRFHAGAGHEQTAVEASAEADGQQDVSAVFIRDPGRRVAQQALYHAG